MNGSAPIKTVSRDKLVLPSGCLALSSIAAPGCSVHESIVISVETKEKDTWSDF